MRSFPYNYLLASLVTLALACSSGTSDHIEEAARSLRAPGDLLLLANTTADERIRWQSPTPISAATGPRLARKATTPPDGVPAVPDSKIAYDLRARLRSDELRGAQLHIHVHDQFAWLQGHVLDGFQADTAELVARRTFGVAGVHNQLIIRPRPTAIPPNP